MAGTALVKDIPGGLRTLVAVGNTLFFAEGHQQLWKSDGTEAGTVPVGPPLALISSQFYAATDSQFFFQGADLAAPLDYELWKSDGTDAGTLRVKDIDPGPTLPLSPDKPDRGEWNPVLQYV